MVSIDVPRQLIDGLTGVSERLQRGIRLYAIALAAALTLLLVVQVVMRYVFSRSFEWVNELSQYLAIWIFLPLAAVLIVEDDHIEISMLTRRLSRETGTQLAFVELLSLTAFSAVFAYAGAAYAVESGFRSVSPSLGVEMFWIYAILPISGVLMGFFSLVRLLHVVDGRTETVDVEPNAEEGPS